MEHKFEGIVLFKRDYREKDALVKIFTQEFGTKMFFVKHYYQANNSLIPVLQPLTCNAYVGKIQSNGLSFLREGSPVRKFKTIQTDYEKQAYAIYLSQLIDASIEDNLKDSLLYEFYKALLKAIDSGLSHQVLTIYCEIHLLKRFGIELNWRHCRICGKNIGSFDFSIRHQGLLCQEHFYLDPFRMHLSDKAIKIAILLATVQVSQIEAIKVSQQTIKELRFLLDELYKEFVGIHLKGKSYINQMLKMEDKINYSLRNADDKA